jgi:DNA-binding MarR family transcriptional regulator
MSEKKRIVPVRATSLLAYEKVIETLGERQLQVMKCLNEFISATNMMLARRLGWDINRVVPRIYELRQKGLVGEHKTDYCKITGEKAIYWRFLKK